MLALCLANSAWFLYTEIWTVSAAATEMKFTVKQEESVASIANHLSDERIIRYPWIFRFYLVTTGRDRNIHAGEFTINPPITMARVASALSEQAAAAEKTITILPGWDLRDIANYLETGGWGNQEAFFALAGQSADIRSHAILDAEWRTMSMFHGAPDKGSLEGYLAPDTYRVFANANLHDILLKLLGERQQQLSDLGDHSWHEVLTLASIVEREVRKDEDRKKVADIFARRIAIGMPLQADSTVHYAVGKKGDLFTTAADRESDNLWNTYKYPGLPPGPIATPSLSSIRAALYPTANDYWYFLTTLDGEVKYARTLDEHNANVAKYLR
jgi:UPF0755 protein